MGQFSWIYSDTKHQLLDDVYADAYLLVPKPFQEKYGNAIHETCYDGYGHFGGYDVYELVALWNRDCLPKTVHALQEPKLENYGGLYDFEKENLRSKGYTEEEIKTANENERTKFYNIALETYKSNLQMMDDFARGVSDNEMQKRYGANYLRSIGINIACYDDDNKALNYPIKITTKEMAYEDAEPSMSDPEQGWGNDAEEDLEDYRI